MDFNVLATEKTVIFILLFDFIIICFLLFMMKTARLCGVSDQQSEEICLKLGHFPWSLHFHTTWSLHFRVNV